MNMITEGAPAPADAIAVNPVDAPVIDAAAPAAIDALAADTPIEPAPAAQAEPAPVPDAAAAEPAPAGSVIEGAEAAAHEASTEGAQAEVPADAEPAALPVYEDWTIPEGVTMPPEQIEAYNGLIGKFGLPQEAGQEIMDYGAQLIKQAHEQMAQQQVDAFESTRGDWRKEFDKQAGNRRNTILDDAKSAIRSAVPDEKARSELWNVLAFTGAGDHPAVINLLAAIGKRDRERGAPGPSINTQPNVSPAQRRYAPRS